MTPKPRIAASLDRRHATIFVVLLGVVSLFADMTYESARSIAGPYLALLGASATVVGVVAGLGELVGYALRLVSGRFADLSGRYWLMTLAGYCLNLVAVPLLALAGNWQWAVMLMFLERAGKAVRSPSRDAMLSFAGHHMGRGWGFALHEAMDQTGATVGPLLVALSLHLNGNYRMAFGMLAIPAVLSLATLLVARAQYPRPRELEPVGAQLATQGLAPRYLQFVAASALIAAGYADYSLIAFHFGKALHMPGDTIAALYAAAMAVQGCSALVLGRLYDRMGMGVLLIAALVAVPIVPMAFLGNGGVSIAGVILWGVGMGAQESMLKATIARMSPAAGRGTAFGVYNLCFGLAWFVGSAVMGVLYDVSPLALVLFATILQILATALMWRVSAGAADAA